ncbi:hypothetical protein Dimus_019253 [Dionaea muscipula]
MPLVEASHDDAVEAGVAASVLLDAAAADRGSRDVGAEDAGADPPKPELLVEIRDVVNSPEAYSASASLAAGEGREATGGAGSCGWKRGCWRQQSENGISALLSPHGRGKREEGRGVF